MAQICEQMKVHFSSRTIPGSSQDFKTEQFITEFNCTSIFCTDFKNFFISGLTQYERLFLWKLHGFGCWEFTPKLKKNKQKMPKSNFVLIVETCHFLGRRPFLA